MIMKPTQKRPDVNGSAPVIFLFNHDAGHQVAHLAGIAGAFALQANEVRAVIAYGSAAIRKEVERLLSPEQIAALEWQSLALPEMLRVLTKGLNRLLPIHRILRLYWHNAILRKSLAIVSTERTCLTLKRHWIRFHRKGLCPAFICVPHGSGDRNVSVHPAFRNFDLLMVSGQKVVDQMVEAGVSTPEGCRIIGYAKFDILRGRTAEKFFDNDNPTFLYNPHFDPHMSSWFDYGADILEYFYQNADRFNLIFAPHVMLFFKKVHISPEYRVTRKRPDIDPKYYDAPNIRIDVDSARLFDMSYTLSADVYIGDVSSQVYEFLYRPRACFFIDTHSAPSSGATPEYDFWNNGPVARTAKQLLPLLPDHAEIAAQYRNAQEQRMAYTADQSDPRPASERGAEAISHFVEGLNSVVPA
jgi:hypothetical protein